MNENNIKIKETFDFLYLHERNLTAFQMNFIEGCKKYFTKNKTLSEKQIKTLLEIRKYLPQEVRFSGSVADNWKH